MWTALAVVPARAPWHLGPMPPTSGPCQSKDTMASAALRKRAIARERHYPKALRPRHRRGNAVSLRRRSTSEPMLISVPAPTDPLLLSPVDRRQYLYLWLRRELAPRFRQYVSNRTLVCVTVRRKHRKRCNYYKPPRTKGAVRWKPKLTPVGSLSSKCPRNARAGPRPRSSAKATPISRARKRTFCGGCRTCPMSASGQ
jgi:hypothetical protein